LGYLFFDTGVMYRAITWLVLARGIAPEDEYRVTRLAEQTLIEVNPASVKDGRAYDIWIEGQDVTWEIRQPEVDANVSVISAYPGVRRALTAQQRRIGTRGQVVMVGRDIGTVVLPEADVKIYLDASVEERARRRYQELKARGEQVDYEQILAAMRRRDEIDSTRKVAPLRPAEDALTVNSDGKTLEEVFEEVMRILASR
jgi:cytidylate kinase